MRVGKIFYDEVHIKCKKPISDDTLGCISFWRSGVFEYDIQIVLRQHRDFNSIIKTINHETLHLVLFKYFNHKTCSQMDNLKVNEFW